MKQIYLASLLALAVLVKSCNKKEKPCKQDVDNTTSCELDTYPLYWMPVCGCNDSVYPNHWAAKKDGVINYVNIPDTFSAGYCLYSNYN